MSPWLRFQQINQVYPACSHMLVSKIKPHKDTVQMPHSPPLVAAAALPLSCCCCLLSLPAALLPAAAAAWKMWNFAILMDPRGPAEIRNLRFCAEDVEPACARRSDRRGGARAEDTKPAYRMDAEGTRGARTCPQI